MYPNLSLKLLSIELRRYITEEPRFYAVKTLLEHGFNSER